MDKPTNQLFSQPTNREQKQRTCILYKYCTIVEHAGGVRPSCRLEALGEEHNKTKQPVNSKTNRLTNHQNNSRDTYCISGIHRIRGIYGISGISYS